MDISHYYFIHPFYWVSIFIFLTLVIFIFNIYCQPQALYHLQKFGVCHRDISLENILVDENTKALVIDLGMCIRLPYNSPNGCDTVFDVSAGTLRKLVLPQGQVSDPCFLLLHEICFFICFFVLMMLFLFYFSVVNPITYLQRFSRIVSHLMVSMLTYGQPVSLIY